VTGNLLTRETNELALTVEHEVTVGFVCSSGWISNFKIHQYISTDIRHGKAGSAPAASVEFAKITKRAKRSQNLTTFLPMIDSFFVT
jgi:hypothetical protein